MTAHPPPELDVLARVRTPALEARAAEVKADLRPGPVREEGPQGDGASVTIVEFHIACSDHVPGRVQMIHHALRGPRPVSTLSVTFR